MSKATKSKCDPLSLLPIKRDIQLTKSMMIIYGITIIILVIGILIYKAPATIALPALTTALILIYILFYFLFELQVKMFCTLVRSDLAILGAMKNMARGGKDGETE